MQDKDIYIVGIGHNSIVTIELAELNGYTIKGLIHYNDKMNDTSRWGYPFVGGIDSFLKLKVSNYNFALSMGDNNVREHHFVNIQRAGGNFPILIHPHATISKNVVLKPGVQIHANATIQPEVTIMENSIISYGVGITHNVEINKNCYIAGHSIIGAYTKIEDNVMIGMGTTTISGKVKQIGKNSFIGAGSLVMNSIEENKIVYGRPAIESKSEI